LRLVADGKWGVRLSFVTPEGNFVDVTGVQRGKRAAFDFVPGALLLFVASTGHGDYSVLDESKRAAMEACLDVLWPKWRDEAARLGAVAPVRVVMRTADDEAMRFQLAGFVQGLRRVAKADITASADHVQGRLATLDLVLEYLGLEVSGKTENEPSSGNEVRESIRAIGEALHLTEDLDDLAVLRRALASIRAGRKT
jgi:hypothetical protein